MPMFFSGGNSSVGSIIAPHPDPKRFVIYSLISLGTYTMATIQYYGCTTFAGKKISIYKASKEEIQAAKYLDPHFLEVGLSPIARFPANKQGEKHALLFLKSLIGETQ